MTGRKNNRQVTWQLAETASLSPESWNLRIGKDIKSHPVQQEARQMASSLCLTILVIIAFCGSQLHS